MKNLLIASLMVLSATSAFADQATDAIDGAVTCSTSDLSVTISADRQTLTIEHNGRNPQVYQVEQEVGDVSTSYTAVGARAPMLSFDDQGDFLMFNSQQKGISIICPQ